ncbi:hypothetical protein Tco_1336676 [Tanacetum coccineum]
MLAQPTKDEGAVSERPSETQPTPSSSHPSEDLIEPQPDLSLKPSSSNPILDSILDDSGGNHGVAQIKDLKSQIKQLKKKAKPVISHHNAWIKSVSMKKRLARKKSLKKKLMHKESISKQGRKPAKSEPTVHKVPTFNDFDDIVDDAMDYMETEDSQDERRTSSKTLELSLSRDTVVLEEKENAEKGVSTEDLVSTTQPKVSTDKPKVSTDKDDEGTAEPKDGNSDESAIPTMTSTPTPTVFGDDETIAQVLITMSQNKVKQKEKEKGVEIKDTKDTDRQRTKIERSILTLKPLPKIDPKAKGKKKIEEEEIEKFSIEQRAKFLHDTIAAQRRFLAQQRSEAIRNKLPTRNQLRNQMMTYLKHVGGYKHAQLNKKKFEEIQVMYEKVKRENERFIPIGSAEDDKLIEKMNKKAAGMDKEEVAKELESSKVEGPKENIRKRSGRRLKMKAPKRSKRQKTDSDHEEENQLRIFLKIVPEEEEKIDYEILGTRYPIINWESKFYNYGHFGRELIYYRVFRADGSSRWIKTFSEMIKLFDRMDLIEIHSLVMKRFKTTPPEGIDLLLWVYVLRLEDATEINMLAERRYPLTKHTLERIMDLRLTIVSDDDIVFDLLRKCIFEGPYKLSSVVIEAVAATVDSPEVPEHDEAETVHNMSEENKLYFKAEKEAICRCLLTVLERKSTQQ